MGTEPDDTQRDRAADEEGGASADAEDAPAEKADARGKPRRDEFWLRLGFESFEEYLAGLEREQSRWQRGRIPDVGTPSLAEVSREALESELTRRRGYRQVGIKLRPDDYEALRRAARAHGVAPSTLARVLTARGARALWKDEAAAGDEPAEHHERD